MSGGREESNSSNLTQDDLGLLLEDIDAGQLVNFLRYTEDLSAAVLQGFRLNRQATKSLVVRQRIVKEALKDGILRDTLVILWRESLPSSLVGPMDSLAARELEAEMPGLAKAFGGERVRLLLSLNRRANVRKLAAKWNDKLLAIKRENPHLAAKEQQAQPPRQAPRSPAEDEKLRRLREERASLLEQVRVIKPQLSEALKLAEKDRTSVHAIQKELAQAKKLVDSLQRKLEREEKARKTSESEVAELKRTVKALGKPAVPRPTETKSELPRPKADLWPDVVTRLLNNRQHAVAKAFCEELIKRQPDDARAHALLCRAYVETGQADMALGECWWMAERLTAGGQLINAAHYACTAVGLDPQSKKTAAMLDRLLKKLDLRNDEMAQGVRRVFLRFSSRSPESHKQVSAAIARAGNDYQRVLESSAGVGPDTILSVESGGERRLLSARSIIDAINSNDTALVEFLRGGLRGMKSSQSTAYRSVIDTIESSDATCAAVLQRRTNPIVVDGSNVAFAYTTTSKKPRLNNILLLRKTLRSQGYFPIYIYADANLRYRIDQASVFEQMLEAQEVLSVASRTDADEAILLEARRRKCPVVTNDRMLEWDPDGQVEKIKFDADQKSVELRPQWDLR